MLKRYFYRDNDTASLTATYRVCVNFKELNKITVFDPGPMMSPDDIFPKLSDSQIYSTFDFSKGYWAIPMEEKSKDVTTFVTSRGLMRFRVMPFGMVNSGSTYNRMVRKLLDGAQSLENYVDDVFGHRGHPHITSSSMGEGGLPH